VPGGWGVMADDVMAGVYANLTVQILIWARPGALV
jgi:phosphatidylglycerophosphatase A